MSDDYYYIDVRGDRPEEPQFKTPEEQYAAANAFYLERCRDHKSYDELKDRMPHWAVARGMSPAHLAMRGHYEHYPSRMVTFGKDKHDRPVFLQCAQCLRHHCTDAWLPFSYSSVWDRVRVSGDGSHHNPYLYWCRDVSQCPARSADDKRKPTMVKSLNYSCASQW